MSSEAKPILVLAGSRAQFEAWCIDNDRSPRDPNVRYVRSTRDVQGWSGFQWTTYGTWYERRDGYDLERELATRPEAERIA